jgi:hypothetical protein
MPIPKTQSELAEIFRKLGATSPEEWARSQLNEEIPQVIRYLFLKQAWERIIVEGKSDWIDNAIARAEKYPNEPYAGLGSALARARAAGVANDDLIEIGRCLQAQTLFSISYLLDGPDYSIEELEDIGWGLFETDQEGCPVGRSIGGLHESVLENDPSGREMRPRSDG